MSCTKLCNMYGQLLSAESKTANSLRNFSVSLFILHLMIWVIIITDLLTSPAISVWRNTPTWFTKCSCGSCLRHSSTGSQDLGNNGQKVQPLTIRGSRRAGNNISSKRELNQQSNLTRVYLDSINFVIASNKNITKKLSSLLSANSLSFFLLLDFHFSAAGYLPLKNWNKSDFVASFRHPNDY